MGYFGKIGSFWFIFDSYHCLHLFIHRITQNLRISFLTSRITHGFETESDLYGRVLKPLWEICGRMKALKLVKNGDYLSFLFYLCTINYS